MALATTLATTVAAQAYDPNAEVLVTTQDRGIELLPATADFGHELRVALPDGTVQVKDFAPGEIPAWSAAAAAEGLYTYELRAIPAVLEHRFDADEEDRGFGSTQSIIATGSFTVREGTILSPDRTESTSTYKAMEKAVLTTSDGVVRNNLCVGSSCPDSPSFGTDTIRVQADNTRFHFDDASTSTGFPANDWRLVANDSTNGGASYFGIEDATAGRRVFSVSAGAPANALFVNSSGRVGLGTSAPVLDMHIAKGNTPGVRLDQTTSGGFTAQVWDVAGNEANFFVRDVTGGSRLPFRVRPGAPTSSIDIASDGDVGLGTSSPAAAMHLSRSDGSAQVLVQETNGTASARELFKLSNNGAPFFIFENTDIAQSYSFAMGATGHFLLSHQQTSGVQMRLTPSGDMTISGSLSEGSSRAIKDGITPLDGAAVLAKLENLPVSEWSYTADGAKRHVGPMAEDFYAAFGLGPDNTHVSPRDLAGVALAAAKALKAESQRKDQRIADLESQNEKLEERLAQIESRLGLKEE